MILCLKKTAKLMCDGYSEESVESSKKCIVSVLNQNSAAKGKREVNNLAVEIMENHSKEHNYSDPQYQLWARMIVNTLHSSKDIPPEVPMITGNPYQTYDAQ